MPRINFQFVLILLLTACTSNVTLAPMPTVTLSPIPSVTPTSTATEIPLIANPITPEMTTSLMNAGYPWDEKTGALTTTKGDTVATVRGDKWVYSDGAEGSIESLKFIETNGLNYDEKSVVVIMREVDGIKEIFLPLTETWVEPLDVVADRAILKKNDYPRTRENFKDVVKIDIKDIPMITYEDYKSGKLFLSNQLGLREWPANVNVQQLWIARESLYIDAWTVRQYPTSVYDEGIYRPDPIVDKPITADTDQIKLVSAFRMIDPKSGSEVIVVGQQYYYNGNTLVMEIILSDDMVNASDPNSPWGITEQVLMDPSAWTIGPVVSLKPGDECPTATYFIWANQQTACNMQSNLGLPQARSLFAPEVQQDMAKFDALGPQKGEAVEKYPLGPELVQLQQYLFPAFTIQHWASYWLPATDPAWDEFFPLAP